MSSLPETMPVAVLHGLRDVRVEARDVPPVGAHDVLIEVSHCGICGSDLHFMVEWAGAARPGSIEGHEYSGTDVAVGGAVTSWQVGDRVVGGGAPRCDRCEYCLAHRPSLCRERGRVGADEGDWQGAFARYKRLQDTELHRVPDHLALKHAALVEPLAVAIHGVNRSGGADTSRRYLVTGAGPIGFLSVAALAAEGVTDIVVSEPHEGRRELCRRILEHAAVPDAAARVVAPDVLTVPAMPHDLVAEPFDVVLECSGNRTAIEVGLAQLKRAGTLVLVGAGISRPRLDNNRILLNELVVTGSYVYDEGGFDTAMDLLASGRMPLDLLVEPDDIPLDGLLEAAVDLHEGRRAAKAMVVPHTRPSGT